MPALTQDCWHVYYGDVHVGTIARRVGCSTSTNWNGAAVLSGDPDRCRQGTAWRHSAMSNQNGSNPNQRWNAYSDYWLVSDVRLLVRTTERRSRCQTRTRIIRACRTKVPSRTSTSLPEKRRK